MMRAILREPLTHFVALGLLVLGAYSWFGESDDRQIVVTAEDQRRLAMLWSSEAGRLPDEREMQGIIAQMVEEQVLYREAIKLGLDSHDTIVRRRMAQKLRFMLEDLSDLPQPSDAQLQEFLDANPVQFADQATVSFNHVFFSPSARGDVEARAQAAARELAGGADWRQVGDPFMLKRSYAAVTQTELAELLGTEFAAAIFALDAGQGWSEPVGSSLGLHLVSIKGRSQGSAPKLDDVRESVASAWREQQSREANRAAVRELVDDYEVTIEPRG